MQHIASIVAALLMIAYSLNAQTVPATEVSLPGTEQSSGLRIGVEGRFAMTRDQGVSDFQYNESEDCSFCPEIQDYTGTTWTTGVSIEYRIRESELLDHGPLLLFQWLGRSLSGVTQSDRLPGLDPDGNVVYSDVYREIVTTTQHLAASAGYGISYANVRFNASIGVLHALWVSGEEYMRIEGPGVFDPVLVPEGEVIDDGRAIVLYRFTEEDINRTQVILQASLTYTLQLDRWAISLGPYYGHTFSSTLKLANGENLSIDDVGGLLAVQLSL